jgi:hypothetical protein
MNEIIDEEPLYTYKRISRPSIKVSDQGFLSFLNMQAIDSLFEISFEDVFRIYQRCFFKKTSSLNSIVMVFQDEFLLKIINYFAVYTVISHNEKLSIPTKHIAEQLKVAINNMYKQILSKIKNQEIGCFSLSLFIGFFVSYFLIKFQFFDKQSDNLNFLSYCVEIVHMRLNGFTLTSNTLTKYIWDTFYKLYSLKAKKRSMINLSLPKSQFENDITAALQNQSSQYFRMSFNPSNMMFIENIDEKFAQIHQNYQDVANEFIKIMKEFIESNKNYEEYAIIRQKPPIREAGILVKNNAIDVNGLGAAIRNNTQNPKKQYCISFKALHKKTQLDIEKTLKPFRKEILDHVGKKPSEKNEKEIVMSTDSLNIRSNHGSHVQKTISEDIREKFEVLNNFEKKIKGTEFKLQKIHRSHSFATAKEPCRESRLSSLNSEFQAISEFYAQLKQDRELRNRRLSHDLPVKLVASDKVERPFFKFNIAKNNQHSEKMVSAKEQLPLIQDQSKSQKKSSSFDNRKGKAALIRQLNGILHRNPKLD